MYIQRNSVLEKIMLTQYLLQKRLWLNQAMCMSFNRKFRKLVLTTLMFAKIIFY